MDGRVPDRLWEGEGVGNAQGPWSGQEAAFPGGFWELAFGGGLV